MRVLMWAVVAVLVMAAVFYAVRLAKGLAPRSKGDERAPPPDVLMGLDVRPESLPDDVPGTAWTLWQEGDPSGSLSLLYRGALIRLIQGYDLEVDGSATEGDCLEAVKRVRGPSAYMGRLTGAWQLVAYAQQVPEAVVVEGLCQEWRRHVGAAR